MEGSGPSVSPAEQVEEVQESRQQHPPALKEKVLRNVRHTCERASSESTNNLPEAILSIVDRKTFRLISYFTRLGG